MRKFNKKIIIVVVIVIVAAILALFFLFGRDDISKSNGVLWNGKQKIEKGYVESSISVPGFNQLSFQSDTTNQKVNIYNPETNSCSMNFSIILPDNTILWESEGIQPGYGLYDIEINKKLEKGTYKECAFTVRCFKDDIELNGCDIAFTLYVY